MSTLSEISKLFKNYQFISQVSIDKLPQKENLDLVAYPISVAKTVLDVVAEQE